MTAIDWLVIAAGASAVGWVLWYFFAVERVGATATLAPASTATSTGTSGGEAAQAPQATITVKGGYSPAVVRVRAGQPVRLAFDRQETSGCSEEVVFADFGIRRYLPAHARTVVEVTPPIPGTYAFTCGMGMLRGKLVAE